MNRDININIIKNMIKEIDRDMRKNIYKIPNRIRDLKIHTERDSEKKYKKRYEN